MVSTVEIYIPSSTIILDSVTFSIEFDKVRIEGGHPSGPVFSCGAARAIVSEDDATRLIAAGVVDAR
ncbi:DUF3203 family protein [Burkholderia ubonensis]|uniref:DUF3203 family protein n=1 Tax=Burkholderia ubonensis TaxID=101571 RepID=UPI0007537BA5|nr:DUF3203 family protein [Burkholderia ubonensis]KUZ86299.1 hypothetical protein WI40_31905 [Burkholderia ubonensis]KVA22791.1 hypothetical protein WI43_13895 [Burkholderia ubonensis]KVA24166.1 hypothetical protein WI42_06365 [Burkholderia ubonensis]KVP77458.1 hypothetical protein WJ93_04855 [Burkholderia ubonensis]KVZ00844.1 hypothetical protein WL11_21455 [Burkholderia ubonensis]